MRIFIYTCTLAMFLPILLPFYHVLYFAPFLVLSYYKYSFPVSLMWSLVCGLMVDMFSAETPLGAYALNYSLITFCVYRYRFHFFEERFLSLALLTYVFTLLSTLIQMGFFKLTGKMFVFSWEWLASACLLLPLQGALYAALFFSLPPVLLQNAKRLYRLRVCKN